MKLFTTDHSELMEVTSIKTEGNAVIVNGTIMGAMPIKAVVSGTEMRKALGLVDRHTVWQIIKIFLRGKGV